MTTYFTSDTHFFHNNIISYCNRPYSDVSEMNEALIANWNSVVKSHDTIWFLGDFSFGRIVDTEHILIGLNGIKHLIMGNHDRIGRCEKLPWSRHFASIHDYFRLKVDGFKFVLCHFPFASWERNYVNLHGHTHGMYADLRGQHDVGVDSNNYIPISAVEAFDKAMKNEGANYK